MRKMKWTFMLQSRRFSMRPRNKIKARIHRQSDSTGGRVLSTKDFIEWRIGKKNIIRMFVQSEKEKFLCYFRYTKKTLLSNAIMIIICWFRCISKWTICLMVHFAAMKLLLLKNKHLSLIVYCNFYFSLIYHRLSLINNLYKVMWEN